MAKGAKRAKREREPSTATRPARAAKAAARKADEPFYQPFSALRTPAKRKAAAPAEAGAKRGAPPPENDASAARPAGAAATVTNGASAQVAGAAAALARGATARGAGAAGGQPAGSGAARGAGAARGRPAGAAPDAPRPVDPETFAIYMAGVRVLEDRVNRIPTTASRVERAAHSLPPFDPDEDARLRMRSLVIEGIRFETTDDGERIEGRRLDVDPRELRRLRRARYGIDGKLDLHGLRLEEARSAVEAFVCKRQSDGDRVVEIVHGKGKHSPGGYAVLRGEIAAWLSHGRVARHVAAFATAPEADGGAGSMLVLLAR